MTNFDALVKWARDRWPLMWRKTHETRIEALEQDRTQQLHRIHGRHERDIKAEREVVRRVVERLSEVEWHRDGSRYGANVSFDSRMFCGIKGYPDCEQERDMLAEMLGEQLARQVRSCRFVEATR